MVKLSPAFREFRAISTPLARKRCRFTRIVHLFSSRRATIKLFHSPRSANDDVARIKNKPAFIFLIAARRIARAKGPITRRAFRDFTIVSRERESPTNFFPPINGSKWERGRKIARASKERPHRELSARDYRRVAPFSRHARYRVSL